VTVTVTVSLNPPVTEAWFAALSGSWPNTVCELTVATPAPTPA
jgi:hypothetical protein